MIARTRFSKNLANGRFSHSGSHLFKRNTDYLRSLFIDLTKILNRSIQIYLFKLTKITLYGSDQDSEWINSDLSGNICSKENRLTKIILYGSDQDFEWINSDLSGNICSKENRLTKITLCGSDQDSEQIN